MLARIPDQRARAIADLQSAMLGWDKLIKQLGANPSDLERQAVAGLYSGHLKAYAGQRAAAITDLSASAKILEGLIGKQPDIPLFRHGLGRAYTTLGQLAGDPNKAAGWYRKGRSMLGTATKRYPENVPYRQAGRN